MPWWRLGGLGIKSAIMNRYATGSPPARDLCCMSLTTSLLFHCHLSTVKMHKIFRLSFLLLKKCVMIGLLSPYSQEIPRTGMSTVARTYKKREGQERLPLCDRLSRPYHCNSCSCSLPPHPLCLTSHPQWMTDRCLLHVHDFRQPFLRYFDQELLSPGHHYGQLTMPNFNTTLPSAVI